MAGKEFGEFHSKAAEDAAAKAKAAAEAAAAEAELDPVREMLKDAGTDQHAWDKAKRSIQHHIAMSGRSKTSAEPAGTELFTEYAERLRVQQPEGSGFRAAYDAMAAVYFQWGCIRS